MLQINHFLSDTNESQIWCSCYVKLLKDCISDDRFFFHQVTVNAASFIQDFEDIDLENLGGDTTTTTERVEYIEMPVENEVQTEMLEEESDEEYDSDHEVHV